MTPIILFREGYDSPTESMIAAEYFPIYGFRCSIPPESLVIGRYSVLPYYLELEHDLSIANSKLINSYNEHRWIANFDYYEDLEPFTFKTWTDDSYPYCGYDGPIVIKGRTNSRKHQWKTDMYAENRQDAIKIACRIREYDDLLSGQGLVYRKYEPLYSLGENEINGLRYSNERRLFCYKDRVLTNAYYWTNAGPKAKAESDARIASQKDSFDSFVGEITKIASKNTNFYVLDIAEKETGGWILVEINDAQMSGLSYTDPDKLYKNLKEALRNGW